ncbi:MAG: hypothetical protein IOD12_10840 [Silvanigrellales bacterium]|nr:hypothetical protein [Silvanigrellales bacterium]
MGLIGYNESTGETCFFNKSSLPADRKIPSANSKDSAAVYDDWVKWSTIGGQSLRRLPLELLGRKVTQC